MGRRLAEHLGRLPDATSFLSDPRAMLRITRRVETVAPGGRLRAGFQTAAKLEAEAECYRAVIAAGTMVSAFGAVVVPVRRDEKRPLVVVDRSGESSLGSPYNDLRGEDDYRPRPDRLLDAFVAGREGRSVTAAAITAATSFGVSAGGWFPTAAGADGLRKRCDASAAVCSWSPARSAIPPSRNASAA